MNAKTTTTSSASRFPLFGPLVFLLTVLLAATAFGQAANTGRDCALCHLDWTEGFNKPQAILLVERPAKSTAAEARSCLGCHDGSVADSRCQVWLQPGHKAGAVPPASMKVPPELPLDDGKITCRTCHTAHATGGSGSLADTVFLRMKNDRGQLCNACHPVQAAGPKAGSHPLTKMSATLPRSLADAGAHAGPDNHQVVCQSCHTAHGGSDKLLLVGQAEGNKLCLSCHQQLNPLMWKPGVHEHSMDMLVNDPAQIKAIADMGTSIGAGNALLCLSCHKVHHGMPGEAMLADTLTDSRLCIRCHPSRAGMAGSTHDLRKSAPAELNARKQTAAQSGPCGACHTFHSYTRQRTPRDGDPQGLCTTCHADGQVASKHTGLPLSHPGEVDQARLPKKTSLSLYPSKDDPSRKALACLTCHDPHNTKQASYLRESPEALCADCHGDKTKSLVGSHDFTATNVRNAQDRTGAETGKCGFCHAVHKANGPAMWVATAASPSSADETCTQCHRKDGIAAKTPAAQFSHPTAAATPTTRASLPLFDERSHISPKGSMACATCHDPHLGGTPAKAMLRPVAGPSLCTECHRDQLALVGGPHDPSHSDKHWPATPNPAGDLCMNCHVPHSNDLAKERWTVTLAPDAAGSDRACLACHADHGWAADDKAIHPGATVHPNRVSAAVLPKTARELPLVTGGGRTSADTMACKTCHNPHSGKNDPSMLRVTRGGTPAQLCVSCHTDQRSTQLTMHATELVNPGHGDPAACRPCHTTHATEGTRKSLLWSAGIDQSGTNPAEQRCLGCHGANGSATRLASWKHPATVFGKAPPPTSQPSPSRLASLPPVNEMTCITCHLPHGQTLDQMPLTPASPTEVRAGWKLMLRPNTDQKLCAPCHGLDAPRMFLYFHNPRLREATQKMLRP